MGIINYAHPVQTAHHVTVEHVDDRRMMEFALKLASRTRHRSQQARRPHRRQADRAGALGSSALPTLERLGPIDFA